MTQVSNDKAVFELAKALKAYDDCNPDVGMGWFFRHFVDRALVKLGLDKSDVDYKKLCK